MMGIPPSDAKRLTYWEFTAMRHGWNERHKLPDAEGEPVEAPSIEFVRARQAELHALGISGTQH
jgi:hypothetical protein